MPAVIFQLYNHRENTLSKLGFSDHTLYTVRRELTPQKAEELLGSYKYYISKGFSICIEVRYLKIAEEHSNDFCGFEWMIDSIIEKGKIKESTNDTQTNG